MPDKMSIAELAAAVKRRDPRLQEVADEVLVRKVLERRPEIINMIYTANERPAIRRDDLFSRVSSRVGQDLNPINTADYISNLIRAIKNPPYSHGGGLKAIGQSLKSTYSDPANAIGDVLAGAITGKVAGEFAPGEVKPATGKVAPKVLEAEPAVDMATRRAPGVPVWEQSMILQERLNSLRLQLKQQLASKDPDYWNTRNKLQDVEAQYKSLFGSGPSSQTMTSGGGGGANYTADQLAEFKRKHGIQ